MSTEVATSPGEVLTFVQFAGRNTDTDERGVCFEFGNLGNFLAALDWLDAGGGFDHLEPLFGALAEGVTRQTLTAALNAGWVTFGVFPFTVEVGSGDMLRLRSL